MADVSAFFRVTNGYPLSNNWLKKKLKIKKNKSVSGQGVVLASKSCVGRRFFFPMFFSGSKNKNQGLPHLEQGRAQRINNN
jgi:hypothetical protein